MVAEHFDDGAGRYCTCNPPYVLSELGRTKQMELSADVQPQRWDHSVHANVL